MWTDRPFFQSTVNLIFGMLADKVRQDFVEDRERLRGAKFDVDAMKAALPQMRDQFWAHVGWIEAQLDDGRPWLLGELSLADINAYMNLWYTRSNLYDADQAIAGLDQIFAARAIPQTPVLADPNDPNGRQPGDLVSVTPDDYGKVAVSGKIVSLSA